MNQDLLYASALLLARLTLGAIFFALVIFLTGAGPFALDAAWQLDFLEAR